MIWPPDVEIKFEDMFIYCIGILERDGQTPHDGIGLAYA